MFYFFNKYPGTGITTLKSNPYCVYLLVIVGPMIIFLSAGESVQNFSLERITVLSRK